MTVIILISILAIVKLIIFVFYNRSKMTQEVFNASFNKILFQTLGFSVQLEDATGKMKLMFWGSFYMETFALIINSILYFYYKSLATARARRADYVFVYNSMYLGQYRKLQLIYFLAIFFDTFFA